VTDCGGRAAEKKRWPGLFEEKPHWVVFVVALNDYCVEQKPTNKNRLSLAVELWKEARGTPLLKKKIP
jgi:hypothetical protein